MTGTELAAVIVAIASVAAVALLAVALLSILRTLRTLKRNVEALTTHTVPVMVELGQTVRTANAELDRFDGILGAAESISGTVDSASKLAYRAFSNPVIKVIAVGSGTGRAVRRMRTRGAK